MNRNSPFNNPLFLGFDHFERMIEQLAKSPVENYPPYNIEKTGDNSIKIVIAVAGFLEEELDIVLENNNLVVRGTKTVETEEKFYLYRGIANRHFQRIFLLAEGMEVDKAYTDNGLLNIEISRPEPETKIRKIKIDKKIKF